MEKECSGWKKIEKLISEVGTSIRHWRVSTKFRLKLDQINTKRIFPNWKNENCHRILHIQINLGSKIQLEQIFWFSEKISKKGYTSGRKHKKIIITIEFFIFFIVLVPMFSLNLQLGFFGPNLPKRVVFSV